MGERLTISKLYATKKTWQFFYTWQDYFGIYHSRFNVLKYYEHDFVMYSTRKTTSYVWLKIVTAAGDNEGIKIHGAKNSLLTDFVSSKRDKRSAVEIDFKPLNICNRTIFPTLVQNMFVSF